MSVGIHSIYYILLKRPYFVKFITKEDNNYWFKIDYPHSELAYYYVSFSPNRVHFSFSGPEEFIKKCGQ